ncbi:MAG: 4a-hydroxytetrahydrobiopterin dehydratase [FCB group bacterium]|jgi:4a-hydroxytetrahydrobiopterin dehydratase|nr:4a-hydroxytetrahydrobiopterin dehydratase [FCB group bacterium]
MASELAQKECQPCKGGIPPLKGQELNDLQARLGGDWKVVNEHHLENHYDFDDWMQAADFTHRVAQIADEQNHHPDIHLSYGKVKIEIWTHKIDGLTESDFVLAAKVDEVREP